MNLMFWVIAIITLGAALKMVLCKNIFHSALYMLVAFLGVAGVYLMLYADYMAAVQVLVYGGAITVFVVFGIMLTTRGSMEQSNLFTKHAPLAAIVSVALIAVNALMFLRTNWAISDAAPPEETINQVADLMLQKYVVPFEVAAILLLVALIGAVIIAKEVKKTS